MKKSFFTGCCTALVTPFENGKLNLTMLKILLERQMNAGIGAVVLSGTTGEAPTLYDEEKLTLFQTAKAFCGSGCTILAGTGSNDTRHAVELSRRAEDAGADGLLVVSPYYNKATPDGLIAHFHAIAAAVHIPVILYNVPSRTGVDIPVEVYRELSQISNIAGVKEASTDLGKIAAIRAACPREFSVWSGNDELTVPVMSLGGQGVISVASNVVPMQMEAMARSALAGDFDSAADLQITLLPLIKALFCTINPIPVKEAMKLLGYDCGPCRMPLTALTPAQKEALGRILHEAVGPER